MKSNDPAAPTSDADSWQTKEVFDQAKHDLQSRFSDVKDAAQHTVHEVRAAASTTAAAAREGYDALRQDATAHFASYSEELEYHIRAQPLKSIGLAALGGLVLGLVIRK